MSLFTIPSFIRCIQVAKVTDTDGNEIGGATGKGAGYKYFGAAKLLPGVRELFEKEAPR